ncbi:hypothetical protein B0H14DRAFT_3167995 [Mycena olivaceomarginata]|nr:hypothetical protein B0H14DRAFT_3167995 [Mycena olivaceomarginata]
MAINFVLCAIRSPTAETVCVSLNLCFQFAREKLEGLLVTSSNGGDVILGADGCFSYRHLRSAGDGPISYDPSYFISSEKVHRARDKVAEARKKAPAKPHSHTPTETVDGCEETWNAANEKKQKADPKRYDASGIFAMTCRHSQVLFLANIDTPREQHHYLVALMEELRETPSAAGDNILDFVLESDWPISKASRGFGHASASSSELHAINGYFQVLIISSI